MLKTTSNRESKLHSKQRMDENFDPDEHQEKERKRIAAIRKRQKLQREQSGSLKGNYRLKETTKENIQAKENQ